MTAGDTFRAAAVEQLKVWGERTDSKVIAGEEGTDPASVIFNGVQHGVQAGADFVLCDTAGRLHTKLSYGRDQKVRRAAGKAFEGAPHEVILVVDGTSGQNALIQARVQRCCWFNRCNPNKIRWNGERWRGCRDRP